MTQRASTSAGRQRAAQRTRGGAHAKSAAKGTAKKAPVKGKAAAKAKAPARGKAKAPAKRSPAKRTAVKRASAAKKPVRGKASTRKTAAKPAAPRRTAARRLPPKPPKARRSRVRGARPSLRGVAAAVTRPRNIVIAVLVLFALGAGYRFWLRDSSLVAVEQVKVAGAEGPEAEAVTKALKASGDGMSTLNADQAALEKAVAGFPTVAGVSVETDFPHGMTVTVDSRPPVMMIDTGANETPVAGDGTILAGVDEGNSKLPVVELSSNPTGDKVSGDALSEALVLGGAPGPLQPLVEKVRFKADKGVVVDLAGLPVIFGTADRVAEKWMAVSATLADPSLDALSYLDVRVPERPAAGGAGETLADAPDPATIASTTDIVPAATDTTTDPATEAPVVEDPAAATVDPATDPTASQTSETAAPPAATETATPSADTGGEVTAGGVAP